MADGGIACADLDTMHTPRASCSDVRTDRMPLRALVAFLALPGVVAFAVPLLIAAAGASRAALLLPGLPVVAAGTALLLWCVRDFLVVGRGTLAPWDPPRRLVVTGPYRHLRNPMYVGVLTLVAGWAILFASWALLAYALVLALGFHLRVRLSEEPWLASRFGADWERYRAHVRRWWPRRAPCTDAELAIGSDAPACTIAPARPADVAALPGIELAAARLLAGHAPPAALAETTDEAEFHAAASDGRLWVARDGDVPVGFALVKLLSPRRAHLEEVDVLPSHGRRGLGAALVRAICAWAERQGCAEVTLTTFRDVPWNMPFYGKLGFVEIGGPALDAPLADIVREEAARGLARDRRVVMRRVLHPRHAPAAG